MSNEQKLFLEIIRDHMQEKKTTVPKEVDWTVVAEYERNHQLVGMVYYQCRDQISEGYRERFQKNYLYQISVHSNRKNLLQKVDEVFTEQGIPYTMVKGMEVAQYYPVPALRTMGDCDIVVKTEDRTSAGACLEALGMKRRIGRSNEWEYYYKGMLFELHDRLLYDELVNNDIYKLFTDKVWEYVKPVAEKSSSTKLLLDNAFHLVFLLLHLRKHMLNQGVGFRMFMDIAIWAENVDIDHNTFNEMLKACELEHFAQVCFACCNYWFGCDFEIKEAIKEELDEAFFEKATELTFKNGVYGRNNEENKQTGALNNVKKYGKAKSIFKALFPSRTYYYHIPECAFVKEKPYLLPAAWAIRYYLILKDGKIKYCLNYASAVVHSDGKMDEREEWLHVWGI